MFGLVNVSFSLPKWQAVKLTFFAPWNEEWLLASRKLGFFLARPVTPIFSDATGHTSPSCYEHTNGPFPHSCKQRHQLEAQVDKIPWFVWNCSPKSPPHFFMFAHWRVMQKRSITPLLQNLFWLEKKQQLGSPCLQTKTYGIWHLAFRKLSFFLLTNITDTTWMHSVTVSMETVNNTKRK